MSTAKPQAPIQFAYALGSRGLSIFNTNLTIKMLKLRLLKILGYSVKRQKLRTMTNVSNSLLAETFLTAIDSKLFNILSLVENRG